MHQEIHPCAPSFLSPHYQSFPSFLSSALEPLTCCGHWGSVVPTDEGACGPQQSSSAAFCLPGTVQRVDHQANTFERPVATLVPKAQSSQMHSIIMTTTLF